VGQRRQDRRGQDQGHHHPAVPLLPHAVAAYAGNLGQGHVDDAPLVGIERLRTARAAVLDDPVGQPQRLLAQGVVPDVPVALALHHQAAAIPGGSQLPHEVIQGRQPFAPVLEEELAVGAGQAHPQLVLLLHDLVLQVQVSRANQGVDHVADGGRPASSRLRAGPGLLAILGLRL
jgi:hypothetical protein